MRYTSPHITATASAVLHIQSGQGGTINKRHNVQDLDDPGFLTNTPAYEGDE